MYAKNAASPERITVGPVVQISDGAVQTSGVSVSVLPQGGAAAAGGGTLAYEQGIVHYIPTQAETNYTSFAIIVYKTGCIPATVTVVTTAASVSGTAILASATHTGAVIPTVTTLTGHTAQTGDSFARLGAPAGASVSADVAAVKSDSAAILVDTGTTLDARIPAALVGGRMDASVGAMAANVLTAASTAADFLAEIPVAVWDESIASHLAAGSMGIYTAVGGGILVDGTVTGVPTSTSFTFTGGSTANGFYNDQLAYIITGTGLGQVRPILSSTYSTGTTTITVEEAFAVTPAAADRFVIISSHVHPLTQVANAVLDVSTASHATAGTVGKAISDAATISAAVKVKTDFLPSATAGAAGGVFIAGTNAATTVTTALTTTFTGNVTGSVGSVTARVTANTDQLNGVATAAARLALSTQGIVTATVGAASTTTSIVTSAMDPAAAVADQFKGRIITFNQATTTANLRGQSTDITANTAAGVLTVTALTTAPVSGDTFVIT